MSLSSTGLQPVDLTALGMGVAALYWLFRLEGRTKTALKGVEEITDSNKKASGQRQADREAFARLDERFGFLDEKINQIMAGQDRLEQRVMERLTPRARRGSDQTVE